MRIILIFVTSYNTKQKTDIIDFFRNHSTSGYTADEVLGNISGISKATVYRIISHLEEEGLLMKVPGDDRRARYQFTDPDRCPGHMHIVCSVCGCTFHLDSSTSCLLRDAVSSATGYEVLNATVLQGICPDCREKRK